MVTTEDQGVKTYLESLEKSIGEFPLEFDSEEEPTEEQKEIVEEIDELRYALFEAYHKLFAAFEQKSQF